MRSKDEIGFFLRWSTTRKMRTLETERLSLRPFHQGDLKYVVHWTEPASALRTEADAQGFLDFSFRAYREWGIGPWAMVLNKTGVVVGNCGFCHITFKDYPGAMRAG
jgi:RimJ/RimL family protein N-acetyltransferase